MKSIDVITHQDVEQVFNRYPDSVREHIVYLRQLIITTATEIDHITSIEETLKWGEPSYLVKKGSTIRIDWKKSKPKQYAMYFSCSTKLVPTFRVVYKDMFTFEGNRAIVFNMHDRLPEIELKNCIAAGLTYHKIKQLPMLGL